MAVELDMGSRDFEARFAALLGAKRESAADVDAAVGAIIDDVRARGDAALADYSLRFDRVDVAAKGIEIGAGEIDAAVELVCVLQLRCLWLSLLFRRRLGTR